MAAWHWRGAEPFAQSPSPDMSENPLRIAAHNAGPRGTRAVSNPASATNSMITAVVSELA